MDERLRILLRTKRDAFYLGRVGARVQWTETTLYQKLRSHCVQFMIPALYSIWRAREQTENQMVIAGLVPPCQFVTFRGPSAMVHLALRHLYQTPSPTLQIVETYHVEITLGSSHSGTSGCDIRTRISTSFFRIIVFILCRKRGSL